MLEPNGGQIGGLILNVVCKAINFEIVWCKGADGASFPFDCIDMLA